MTEGEPMTTAIALSGTDVPVTVPEMMQVANFLQHSTMLPKHLVGEPASLFAVMLKARALNIPMATAFENVIVQDGKTGLTASLMQALVNRAQFSLYPVPKLCTGESATVRAVREGIGDDGCGEALVSFSLEDAEKAHLIERTKDGGIRARSLKDNAKPWELYTKDMMVWRAMARACRFYFSDVLMGMVYTPDELGATVGPDGNVVRVEAVRVDTISEDVKRYILVIHRTNDEDTLRKLYDEIREAGMLAEIGPDGLTLGQIIGNRKVQLDKEAQAAARKAEREAKKAAAASGSADTEDAPAETAADDSTDAHTAESDAPADDTDTEGSTPVVSHEPAANPESDFDALTETDPDAADESDFDTEDTPRRRAVLDMARKHFGGQEAAEYQAVQHFQRPVDTIGTPELQEWLTAARKASTR